jgi:starch phosphorylase
MKFQMNGAVTIGTLDGANIEIRKEVGEENFLLFGLTTPEVEALQRSGYRPLDFYERIPLLREVIDGVQDGRFSKGDRSLFAPLVSELLGRDSYMLLADFESYSEIQKSASTAYSDATQWGRMSILNTARSGRFSSDRSIREYCRDIWDVPVTPLS